MGNKLPTLLLFLFSLAGVSCGIEIHSDEEYSYDEFVSYSIYEIEGQGRLQELYSSCINLDDYSDSSGTVHIDSPYEDLYLDWQNNGGSLNVVFEDDIKTIHSTSFKTYYFRSGNTAEFSIGTDYSDYLIELSGPYCK